MTRSILGLLFFVTIISDALADTNSVVSATEFTNEGQLTLFSADSGLALVDIDIEIADSMAKIKQGLMYRSSMPEKAGMFFIYDTVSPRTFWMRNTLISLDIIFISQDLQVVTIQPNTQPYSRRLIPSIYPVQYVLEVNAGFCRKYRIRQGDQIQYRLH